MESVTVLLGLSNATDTQLLERARNHVTMIEDNGDFPAAEVTPPLPTIKTAIDDFEASITECLFNGGKVAYELKRTRQRGLYALIKALCGYVQANCSNDRNKVLRAGFKYRVTGTPVVALGMPENLRALLTDFEGTIPLKWNKVAGAENYIVYASKNGNAEAPEWEVVAYTSRTDYRVEALESAKFFWFRVQAIGRKGLMSPMSETVRALAA